MAISAGIIGLGTGNLHLTDSIGIPKILLLKVKYGALGEIAFTSLKPSIISPKSNLSVSNVASILLSSSKDKSPSDAILS